MNVSLDEVFAAVKRADVVGVNMEEIDPSQAFSEQDLGSLEVMAILFSVEEAFSIKIPDEDMDQLTSVEAISQYLEAR